MTVKKEKTKGAKDPENGELNFRPMGQGHLSTVQRSNSSCLTWAPQTKMSMIQPRDTKCVCEAELGREVP